MKALITGAGSGLGKDMVIYLMEKGYEFKSETDTEVIPKLVDFYYKGDLLDAVMEAIPADKKK